MLSIQVSFTFVFIHKPPSHTIEFCSFSAKKRHWFSNSIILLYKLFHNYINTTLHSMSSY